MAFVTLRADQPRRIDRIIIHCSAVGPNQTSSARQIDEWHRAKGWKMIGYHYVIRRDGSIEFGRPADMIGAHTSGLNSYSLGICYEGGLNEFGKAADTRTPEQKTAMLALLKHLKKIYPHATIHGHNEFAPKACPCVDVRTEYGGL